MLNEARPSMEFPVSAGYAMTAEPVGASGAGPPKMTDSGMSCSITGGTVVVVTVVGVASLEFPLEVRTMTIASNETVASTAMRRRSYIDRATV